MCLSIVNGSLVRFNEKTISEWFDIHAEKYKLNVNGVSNDEILTYFGGIPTDKSLDQKDLSPFQKLLFQHVWHFVLPSISKRTQVSLMDLFIMYFFANNIKVNFLSLMINHLTS